MIDRLTSMAVFVKAADLGSFTAAGAALGLSPQMVGKHVQALEARLGSELIRRTTRRQSLTEIGRTYRERCRAILADIEAAEAVALDDGPAPRGRLRINAPVTFGACCLAPLVGLFLDANPEVSVELTLADRYVDLIEEGYDAAIRLGPLPDSTLLARTLAPHRLIACAAPAYLARRGMPEMPEALVAHDCLGFVYSSGALLSEWRFSRGDETRAVEIRPRFQSNDSRVLHAAALEGRGIVLQAERVLEDDLASGRLVRVLTDYETPSRPMHMLLSASRRQRPVLRSFIDRVAEAFG